jgi:hypothetical protein
MDFAAYLLLAFWMYMLIVSCATMRQFKSLREEQDE